MIKDLMNTKVLCFSPDDTLSKLVGLMKKEKFTEAPVVDDNNKVIGLISYFDVLNVLRIRGEGKVKNFMHSPHVIKENTSINEVLELLINSGVHGFPVVNEYDKVKGFVNDFDLLELFKNEGFFKNLTVDDLSVKKVRKVKEGDKLGSVKKLIKEDKVSVLPVVNDNNEVIGMVRLKNVLENFYKKPVEKIGRKSVKSGKISLMDLKVSEVMQGLISAVLNSGVNEVVNKMLVNDLKEVVILNSLNQPIGVIERLTLLKHVRDLLKESEIKLTLSGDISEDLIPEVKSLIIEDFKTKPGYAKRINEIKVFVKKVHNSRSAGKSEVHFRIVRDDDDLIIKKTGFNILKVMMECIDTGNKLLREEWNKLTDKI